MQAKAFAGRVLMPKRSVKLMYADLLLEYSGSDETDTYEMIVSRMAQFFQVSKTTVRIRLKELCLHDDERKPAATRRMVDIDEVFELYASDKEFRRLLDDAEYRYIENYIVKYELDDLEFQMENRLVDKAELATQEVQIRSLLKMIDGNTSITDIEERCTVKMVTEGEEEQSGAVEDDAESDAADDGPCDHSAACYELADFYDRTDRIPTDTSVYSEDLVKRYIQSITVRAKHLVVKFKAGVEIKVQA